MARNIPASNTLRDWKNRVESPRGSHVLEAECPQMEEANSKADQNRGQKLGRVPTRFENESGIEQINSQTFYNGKGQWNAKGTLVVKQNSALIENSPVVSRDDGFRYDLKEEEFL